MVLSRFLLFPFNARHVSYWNLREGAPSFFDATISETEYIFDFPNLSLHSLWTRVLLHTQEWEKCTRVNQTCPKEKWPLLLPVRRGEGGRCLQGNLWYSPPASMTSCLTSMTFKMATKVFIEETDNNFDFTTEILFWFLGFGDFRVPIDIEN